jgi:hypothetical protein
MRMPACGNIAPRTKLSNKNSTEVVMKVSRILASLFGPLSFACAFIASAGINEWTFHGPIGDGAPVVAIAAHPTNGAIALASTPRGIYRTADYGATWIPVKDDFTNYATKIVFDPSNPNRVIACDNGLYLSSDGGQTFSNLPAPGAGNEIHQIAIDTTGTRYALTFAGRLYRSVAPFSGWAEIAGIWSAPGTSSSAFVTVDPTNTLELYVGMHNQGIYRSANGGASWALLTASLPNQSAGLYYNVSIDPTDSTRVLAATNSGIYLSTDSGTSWLPEYSDHVTWVGFDPDDPSVALATGFLEIFRSQHRGENWAPVQRPRSAGNGGGAFTAGSVGGVFFATANGVIYSNNSAGSIEYRNSGLKGVSARLVASDDAVYATMSVGFNDVYRRGGSEFYPLDWMQSFPATSTLREFSSFSVAAGNSDQIFAVNSRSELIQTFDRGAHWTTPHHQFIPTNNDALLDVQIDPSDPQVAYVSRNLTGVWKTVDGGGLFTRLIASPTHVGLVGVSPHDNSVLYAVGGNPGNDTGIYKSVDAGASWVEQIAPQPSSPSRSFSSFTFHPVNPNVVYASAQYGGVYRTTNGGTTWQQLPLPFDGGSPAWGNSVLIDPAIPTTISVVTCCASTAVLRSVDGGATWERINLRQIPGPRAALGEAALDPVSPSVIIATAQGSGVAEYRVAPDLALSMVAMPSTLPVSGTASTTVTLNNLGPHASSASEIRLDVPTWLTPSAPGCTRAGSTLSCPFGVIRVGESRSVLVSFAVGSALQSSGQINASFTSHESDWNTANNTAGQSVAAAEIADVDVAISASATTLDRGSTANVTVNVSNSGPSPSTTTQLALVLPMNMSASNIATSRGSCTLSTNTPAADTISCALGTLAANAGANVTFALHGDEVGGHTLTADASGAGQDTDGVHTASRAFIVRPVADLTVTLDESADPVTVGAGFQYVATVTNNSGDGGDLTVSIPVTGAVITGATANFGTCSTANNAVTCSSLGLSGGATGNVTINLTSDVPGIATATATVSFSGTDTNPANNTATIGTTLRLVGDISVEIAESADPVAVGAAMTYTVTARNAGPNAGTVQLVIPVTNAAITDVVSTSFTCAHTAATGTCNIASLASGASAVITVTTSAPAAGTANISATATFGGVDANVANDSAAASTLVRLTGDLSVEITDSVDPATAGVGFNYTGMVRNLGPNAGAVHLTVPVTGATVSGATLAGGTCTNTASSVTCDIATFASGASAALSISVNAGAAGTASAAATVAFAGADPVAANDSATANTTVNAAPPPPSSSGSSSGGGGGGGGRFDWLALMLLGGLALVRSRARAQV